MLRMALGCFLIAFVLQTPPVSAAEDVEGARDHPLISRYEGAVIRRYSQTAFDEYEAALGPVSGLSGNLKWSEKELLEGKVTRILYRAPTDRSSVEVFRNYESELSRNNFEILFECRNTDCGGSLWARYRPISMNVFLTGLDSPRYVAAKLGRPEGEVYAFVYAGEHTANSNLRGTWVQLDIVELEPMDEGMVIVDAESLGRDIADQGHVAVYGIYFDTDSDEIKPASTNAIDQIAKLMNDNPDLGLYIVGHTDNVGGIQYNMDLSHRRAISVRDALVETYGIDRARLGAVGMGFFGPVASNRTPTGRALNRRVELVEF